jgi:hypothetical protein
LKSAFFARAFTVVCVLYGAAVEGFCRLATGESAVVVLPAWLEKGEGRIILAALWILATPGALALLADHIRNVFVSVTGKAESAIFLGDRLREGFYVVREADSGRQPLFVEHFVARDQYPSRTFGTIYMRRILLKDAEGNLTAAEALSTGKTVIFSVAQLFLLMLSAGPWISIAGQFKSGFTVRGDLPQAMGALALPDELMWGVLLLAGVFYLGSIAVIAWATRNAKGGGSRVLPLPKSAHRGALLRGTVVASEIFDLDNTSRDAQNTRFYKRYAFRFEGPDFPFPVHLNWWAQRVHEGNIGVTVGKRTRELERQKAYFDGLFEHLDAAIKSAEPVECRVDADLAVAPNWEGGAKKGSGHFAC